MGTRRRSDLRGFLKQSQKKTSSEIDEGRSSSSFLINSGSRRKECCDDEEEEVVKYISKLPGYLQGGDEESLQSSSSSSSVLNVGVLDWSRLEKWKKHGRARVPPDTSGGKTERKVSSTRDAERVKSRRRSPSSSPLLSTMGTSGGSRNLVVRDKVTEKRAGLVLRAQEARDSGKHCFDKYDGEGDKTVGGLNADLTCEKHKEEEEEEEVSNIVLLRSRKHSLLSTLPSSLDDNNNNAKVAREVIPCSFDLDRDSEDMMLLPLLLGVDLSGRKEPPSGVTTRHSKTASRRMLDQEIQQQKKRDPSSPSKRFSFSFGRLSTSFTFKGEEDYSASDSMRLDGSACQSQSSYPKEKKQNTHGGSRVSPLRRLLLDPLLKPKENILLPSKQRRSTSFNQDEKNKQDDASRTRALLQLTIRNGIPLFQFVVDDDDDDDDNLSKSKSRSRSVLEATMKSSSDTCSSLVKDDDSVQYCTFYSVNQVKKKKGGSWLIHHGHNKEKQQHRFVYNVIGEMRLCNSSAEQKPENIRESVLVGEREEGVKGKKEVAAVVIKKKKKKPDEEENNGETTVIIPGGVHSIPERGVPTPLIRRWRSGGCCDCGGWDVGCKLHLLHDLFDHQTFKLFHQEESDGKCGPVLAMTELKRGIYRVEFGSSFLSHLQAFFVCVTVITCASEETVSKTTTTGRSSSPFAPPLSPVGRA